MQGKREQVIGLDRRVDAINNVFRKFIAFHDETGRLNVDGMNIISNDGSNKLNRSRKARVSYKVQRTINASLNAATSTRAVSSNPFFFQAEDGIRDTSVTGVQTCALPISANRGSASRWRPANDPPRWPVTKTASPTSAPERNTAWPRRTVPIAATEIRIRSGLEIGRASCREAG